MFIVPKFVEAIVISSLNSLMFTINFQHNTFKIQRVENPESTHLKLPVQAGLPRTRRNSGGNLYIEKVGGLRVRGLLVQGGTGGSTRIT